MQAVTLLLPGLTDVPLEDLQGKTPLEVARMPCLAEFGPAERRRACGRIGQAFLKLLGSDLQVRDGALLAASLGLDLQPNQVAYGVRLASLGDDMFVDVSDELASSSEGRAFYDWLNQGLEPLGLKFYFQEGAQAVLVSSRESLVRGAREADKNPVELIGKSRALGWPAAIQEDRLLQDAFVHLGEKALDHPINALRLDLEEDPINGWILTGGGGRPVAPTNQGEDWELWTGMALLRGAGQLVGVPVYSWPPEVERFDRVRRFLELMPEYLDKHPHLLVEFPYLWQATYKGALLEKIKTMEWLDTHLLAPLKHICDQGNCRFEVTSMVHTDIRKGRAVEGEALHYTTQPVKQT